MLAYLPEDLESEQHLQLILMFVCRLLGLHLNENSKQHATRIVSIGPSGYLAGIY